MLKTVVTGTDTQHPPLLIAHGLFGSARNWGAIARRLADSRRVLSVDMRNHGESPWKDSHGYPELAADLAEVIDAHGGRADVMGHSMGGKAAMLLALDHPDKVARLTVADIAPVAYDHSQRHLVDAMRAARPVPGATRAETEAALADAIPDRATRAFLLQSLDTKAGAWRLNLDVLDDEMDRITGWPDVSGQADVPALFLAGGESDYVRPDHRETIRGYFPRARFAKIPGAGHWLHAEKPREFVAAVQAWLDA